MYVNWLRKTKPTLLKTHRVMRRRNACTKLYRRREPTFVANVVLCSRTSSNPTFIGVIMRWCLVFTAARTDWMLWTKPWSTFSTTLVSAPTCRCTLGGTTPWYENRQRLQELELCDLRDVHSRRRRTSSSLSNSVPTCPVLTWPGREVCVYFHPPLRYLSGTGWEICSNQLEGTWPIDRRNASLPISSASTTLNVERCKIWFRPTVPVWIGVRMTWKSYPSHWDTPLSASLWPYARKSEREAEKYTFYYHASHFISHILFFKKAQWSDVIVRHEFCMNAFDHVFGKVFGKMQLTVKLEGGIVGKMGSSKTILSIFVTIDAIKRSIVFVWENQHWVEVDGKHSFWISW